MKVQGQTKKKGLRVKSAPKLKPQRKPTTKSRRSKRTKAPDELALGVPSSAQKIRFYSNVTIIYMATLLFIGFVLNPYDLFRKAPQSRTVSATVRSSLPDNIKELAKTGRPVRIVIPSMGIDLVVKDGIYNNASQTWNLSPRDAHFALPSSLANDVGGNTLIYGHNNVHVFGTLWKMAKGAQVQVFADNGYVFYYTLDGSEDVKPDNMGVFEYYGPPILTIQTCSGNWSEKRRLYRFNFERVEP